MRLWITSDWHLETWRGSFDQPAPEFDVLVCAGDVSNDVAESIEYVAAVARGKLAIFVLGNHEYWNDHAIAITLERSHAAAARHGVAFLECNSIDIGGVRFAGATLWTEDDVRFKPSLDFLASSRCDVAISHFEPTPKALSLIGAHLWIHGHHHGHGVLDFGRTKVIRNAGWPDETLQDDSPPAVPGFVVEV
jgi:Calcineurin-like phosphoesterase